MRISFSCISIFCIGKNRRKSDEESLNSGADVPTAGGDYRANQLLADGAAARTEDKIDAARLSPPAVGTTAPLFKLSSSLYDEVLDRHF